MFNNLGAKFTPTVCMGGGNPLGELLSTIHPSLNTQYAIRIIVQNKPNFRKAKMKLSLYSTRAYENEPRLRTQEKTNPNKANFKRGLAKMGHHE